MTELVLAEPQVDAVVPQVQCPFHGGPADGEKIWVQFEPDGTAPTGVVIGVFDTSRAIERRFQYHLAPENEFGYFFHMEVW